MKEKKYKEPMELEDETYIHVLNKQEKYIVYTNNVSLQKQLNKLLGEPSKEFMIKKSIAGSEWEIPFNDISKRTKLVLKSSILGFKN